MAWGHGRAAYILDMDEVGETARAIGKASPSPHCLCYAPRAIHGLTYSTWVTFGSHNLWRASEGSRSNPATRGEVCLGFELAAWEMGMIALVLRGVSWRGRRGTAVRIKLGVEHSVGLGLDVLQA
jgi:hypothetical protein